MLSPFETIYDTPKNLSGTSSACHPFHILTAFVSRPNSDHITVSEANRPVIPEISGCSRFNEYVSIREIECGI